MDNATLMSNLTARKEEVLRVFNELESTVHKAQMAVEEQRNIIVEAQNKQRVLQGEYKVIVELMEELNDTVPTDSISNNDTIDTCEEIR